MHVYGLLAASESYLERLVPNAPAKAVRNACYNSLKETSSYDRLRAPYIDFLTGGICLYSQALSTLLRAATSEIRAILNVM